MYQSDIDEVYKKFFAAVKKAVTVKEAVLIGDYTGEFNFGDDAYTMIAKVRGMVDLVDGLVKEEEE
jgi:hypothetical protein